MKTTHQKLIFHDTKWKPFFFADLYRFGEAPDRDRPLVYYIGGAGDSQRFADRVNTEPETLVNEFLRARVAGGHSESVDLLVSPAPLTTPEQRETRLDDFQQFFVQSLIPKFRADLPPAIGFVGSAYGSFFATHLAFRLRQVRALALISGMGMIEACEKQPRTLRTDIAISCYSNADDEIRQWTDDFKNVLAARNTMITVHRQQGERRFDDYQANGSVRDAFGDVLKGLMEQASL